MKSEVLRWKMSNLNCKHLVLESISILSLSESGKDCVLVEGTVGELAANEELCVG